MLRLIIQTPFLGSPTCSFGTGGWAHKGKDDQSFAVDFLLFYFYKLIHLLSRKMLQSKVVLLLAAIKTLQLEEKIQEEVEKVEKMFQAKHVFFDINDVWSFVSKRLALCTVISLRNDQPELFVYLVRQDLQSVRRR